MEMPVETYVNTGPAEAPVQVDQGAAVDIPAIPGIMHGAFQQALEESHGAQGTPEVNGQELSPDGEQYLRQRFPASSYKSRTGPSFCQVAGCGISLESHKDYHQRYKVCEAHLKVDFIERDGQRVRFCQQCGRFQPLDEFDDNKRSCRARLERHNARRRKRPRDDGSGAGVGGVGGPTSSGGGLHPGGVVGGFRRMGDSRGLLGIPSMPLQPRDLHAMQEALHFASTTLLQASQSVHGAGAGAKGLPIPPLPGQEASHLAQLHSLSSQLGGSGGKEGGGEAGEGGGMVHPMPLPGTMGTMPFVPTPEILLLLLRGYANMFHYDLDDAQIRARLPPSNLPPPPPMPPMDAVQVAVDPSQMQQLVHMQQLQQAAQQAQHGGVVMQDGTAAAQQAQQQQDEEAAAAAAAVQQQYASAEHVQQQYEQYAVAVQQDHEAVQQQYVAAVQAHQEAAAAAAAAAGQSGQGGAAPAGEGEGEAGVGVLTTEQMQAATLSALAQGAEAAGAAATGQQAGGGEGAAAAGAAGPPTSLVMATLPLMMAAGMPHLAAAAGGHDPGAAGGHGEGGAEAAAAQLSADALLMHQYILQAQQLQLAQLDPQQAQQALEGAMVAPEQAVAAVQQAMQQHHEAALAVAAAAQQAVAVAGSYTPPSPEEAAHGVPMQQG